MTTAVLIILVILLLIVLAGGLLIRTNGLKGIGWHMIPDGKVGIVYKLYGHHPHDRFRVRTYGSSGPQAKVLEPNTRKWLPPHQYRVVQVDQVHVPDGTIGLVTALAGAIRPAGRHLCRYVECDHYQDGETFLNNGGEQGNQLAILPGGAYYTINTELFRVHTVRSVSTGDGPGELTAAMLRTIDVPTGHTGVVNVREGEPPGSDEDALGRVVSGHEYFQKPWVFLWNGGQQGVQSQTLPGGTRYSINPWFADVVLIPTRELRLEWTNKADKQPGNFDSALEQIVVNIEGHRLSLELYQNLRIPALAAPRLVKRYGDQPSIASADDRTVKPVAVQRFVSRVLGGAVAGYFTELVGKYTITRFIEEYGKVRLNLQVQVTNELLGWGVVAGPTTLAEFTSEDEEINQLFRRRVVIREDLGMAGDRVKLAKFEAAAEQHRIDSAGEREVIALRKQIDMLGLPNVVMERYLEQFTNMPVPQVIGSGDIAERLLQAMPFHLAQEKLEQVIRKVAEDPGAASTRPRLPRDADGAA